MLKTSFENLNDSNREEHPLSFLLPEEKCYAFAKGITGFYYIVRHGSTWKIIHVSKRNQIKSKTVWSRYAPNFPIPPTKSRLEYFESVLDNVKLIKRRVIPKDKQMKKVYRWDNACLVTVPGLNDYISILEANDIADQICSDLQMKKIKIRYLKQRKNYATGGFSYGSNVDIIDANRQTLLHEVAHVVHTRFGKKLTGISHFNHANHGPEFVAFYAFLLKKYGNFEEVLKSLQWDEIDCDMKIYNEMIELYDKAASVV